MEYGKTTIGDNKEFTVCIENLRVSRPSHVETDGTERVLLPNEARLRNLTYQTSVVIDIVIWESTKVEGEGLIEESCDEKLKPHSHPVARFLNCVICKLP
eukprot:2909363-Pyramimonas_sp.AAC.1